MRSLGTLLVCTIEVSEAVRIAACWDGGPDISVFVDVGGEPRRTVVWPIWNPIWETPLIEPTRASFERFVVGRLSQPGAVDEVVELAAGTGDRNHV